MASLQIEAVALENSSVSSGFLGVPVRIDRISTTCHHDRGT
jgi:hypothetical protein